MNKLIKRLALVTIAILPLMASAKSEAVDTKVNGYTVNYCYEGWDGSGDFFGLKDYKKEGHLNFCSENTTRLYDKVLKTAKPNFHENFVLTQFTHHMKKHGEVLNYAAIDPKTKEVMVAPFYLATTNGKAPKVSLYFSLGSAKMCILNRDKVDVLFTNPNNPQLGTGELAPNDMVCSSMYDDRLIEESKLKWYFGLLMYP